MPLPWVRVQGRRAVRVRCFETAAGRPERRLATGADDDSGTGMLAHASAKATGGKAGDDAGGLAQPGALSRRSVAGTGMRPWLGAANEEPLARSGVDARCRRPPAGPVPRPPQAPGSRCAGRRQRASARRRSRARTGGKRRIGAVLGALAAEAGRGPLSFGEVRRVNCHTINLRLPARDESRIGIVSYGERASSRHPLLPGESKTPAGLRSIWTRGAGPDPRTGNVLPAGGTRPHPTGGW